MDIIVDSKFNQISTNITKIATIISKVENTEKTYIVESSGVRFSADAATDYNYKKDDEVYVIINNQDTLTPKQIIGIVDKTKTQMQLILDNNDKYDISDSSIYADSSFDIDRLKRLWTEQLLDGLRAQAVFSTLGDFTDTEKDTLYYGIKFQILYNDGSVQELKLDIDDIIGNPYILNQSLQEKTYTLNKNADLIENISLVIDNNLQEKIKIENIQLLPVRIHDVGNTLTFSLAKPSVNNYNDELTIEAFFRIKGEKVLDASYKWFRQENNKWIQLNENSNIINLTKFYQSYTYFKCEATKDNITVSEEISVQNINPVILTIIRAESSSKLIAELSGYNEDNYSYQWYSINVLSKEEEVENYTSELLFDISNSMKYICRIFDDNDYIIAEKDYDHIAEPPKDGASILKRQFGIYQNNNTTDITFKDTFENSTEESELNKYNLNISTNFPLFNLKVAYRDALSDGTYTESYGLLSDLENAKNAVEAIQNLSDSDYTKVLNALGKGFPANKADFNSGYWTKAMQIVIVDGSAIVAGSVTSTILATDAIKSIYYEKDVEGSFFNLSNGTFDSPNFKIYEDEKTKELVVKVKGTVEADEGYIGNWQIEDSILKGFDDSNNEIAKFSPEELNYVSNINYENKARFLFNYDIDKKLLTVKYQKRDINNEIWINSIYTGNDKTFFIFENNNDKNSIKNIVFESGNALMEFYVYKEYIPSAKNTTITTNNEIGVFSITFEKISNYGFDNEEDYKLYLSTKDGGSTTSETFQIEFKGVAKTWNLDNYQQSSGRFRFYYKDGNNLGRFDTSDSTYDGIITSVPNSNPNFDNRITIGTDSYWTSGWCTFYANPYKSYESITITDSKDSSSIALGKITNGETTTIKNEDQLLDNLSYNKLKFKIKNGTLNIENLNDEQMLNNSFIDGKEINIDTGIINDIYSNSIQVENLTITSENLIPATQNQYRIGDNKKEIGKIYVRELLPNQNYDNLNLKSDGYIGYSDRPWWQLCSVHIYGQLLGYLPNKDDPYYGQGVSINIGELINRVNKLWNAYGGNL